MRYSCKNSNAFDMWKSNSVNNTTFSSCCVVSLTFLIDRAGYKLIVCLDWRRCLRSLCTRAEILLSAVIHCTHRHCICWISEHKRTSSPWKESISRCRQVEHLVVESCCCVLVWLHIFQFMYFCSLDEEASRLESFEHFWTVYFSITPSWAACLQTSMTSSSHPFRPALSHNRSDTSLKCPHVVQLHTCSCFRAAAQNSCDMPFTDVSDVILSWSSSTWLKPPSALTACTTRPPPSTTPRPWWWVWPVAIATCRTRSSWATVAIATSPTSFSQVLPRRLVRLT